MVCLNDNPEKFRGRVVFRPGGARSVRVAANLLCLALLVLSGSCTADEGSVAALSKAAFAGLDPLASVVEAPKPTAPRADAGLDRSGVSKVRSSVTEHFLFVPSSFSSSDGACDLLLVFHAHRPVLRESVELAGLNAIVVSTNWGQGAGPYERVFASAEAFDELLKNIPAVLARRGLDNPRIRRIAMLSWSAGYGAVRGILSHPESAARIDSALVLDGIHAHLFPNSNKIDEAEVDAYEGFARRAADGDALFVVTHNHIVPEGGKLASVTRTTQLVLDRLGMTRVPTAGSVLAPRLTANEKVYSGRHSFDMQLESVSERGGFVVRAFSGRDPNDHVSHLMCMVPLALAPLVARWSG